MAVPTRFKRSPILSLTGETFRYDLAESVGPDLTVAELMGADGLTALGDLTLSYGTAAGDARLRGLVAGRYGAPVTADDVIVTVGGMQALFLLAFVLCGPGDEAAIASPVFPNARVILEAVGATVRPLPFTFAAGYRLDPDALRTALTPRTRLVSLASPQNPSGVALTEAEIRLVLAEMATVCPEAVLLVDEVYRDAVYGTDVPAPSVVGLDDRIVSCSSLSKCHGAPGLRTGWVVTRAPALRDQLMLGKFNMVVSNSLVDDALATRVLECHEDLVDARRPHLQAGLDRTAAFVADHGDKVAWVRPDAGALCCLRLAPDVFDDAGVEAFHAALRARGVRVAPGAWFGDEPTVFRLGFGLLPIPELEAALAEMGDVLAG